MPLFVLFFWGHLLSLESNSKTKNRYIEAECKKHSASLKRPKTVDEFLQTLAKLQESRKKTRSSLLDEFEADLLQSANFLNDQAKKYQDMKEKHLWLVEYKHVLAKSREIQAKSLPEPVMAGTETKLEAEEGLLQASQLSQQLKIATIAGVIQTDDCDRFKRLIFRITRGTLF